jgi:hypothetical protein
LGQVNARAGGPGVDRTGRIARIIGGCPCNDRY